MADATPRRYLLVASGYPGFTAFQPGGLPSYARLVASALLARGWHVDVLCLVLRGEAPPSRTEGRLALHAVALPRWHWRLARSQPVAHGLVLLRAIHRLVRPDTVMIELPHAGGIGWAAALRYGRRALLRLHTSGRQHAEYAAEPPDAVDRAGWRWDRRTARWVAHRVVATREHARAMAREAGLEPDRFTVLAHGGFPVPERRPMPRDRVLFIGAMETRKGIDLFLAAARAGARQGLRWTVVGRRAAPWAARADAEGVEAPGPLEDEALEALWDTARCVVIPSRYESFGLVAIEAMARGVPVVATDIPVFREVLGDAARLVPPGEPERFGAGVAALLEDAAALEALALRGRGRFEEVYTFERFADRLEAGILALRR